MVIGSAPACANCSAELDPEWKFCIHCGTPVPERESIPGAIRPDAAPRAPLNRLTIVALIVGVVGGIPAIITGHLALRQLRTSGERGIELARVATLLGYVWLLAYLLLAGFIAVNAIDV